MASLLAVVALLCGLLHRIDRGAAWWPYRSVRNCGSILALQCIITNQKRRMGLGVSRDGTRVIALGLITCCSLRGSLLLFLRGYKRLYIQHEDQVGWKLTWSSYRSPGIISDVAASFLSSNCLISQHVSPASTTLMRQMICHAFIWANHGLLVGRALHPRFAPGIHSRWINHLSE
jgi:hypothetical protein